MFWHLFSYRVKCLLRNRELMFWTLLFPLFMATLFHFAFGQMLAGDSFQPIATAVVDDASYQENVSLQGLLTAISKPGERQLLDLIVTGEKEAAALLAEEQIVGIIRASGQGVALQVKRSGLGQSVLKAVLDDYLQTGSTISSLLAQNPAAAHELLATVIDRQSYLVADSFSSATPDTLLVFFYALIATTCLFGSWWGLQNSTHTQANLSAQGLRRSASPTHRLAVILSDTMAALLITLLEVFLLLAYLGLVLGVKFGGELGLILLVCLIGSLTGVAWGTMLGTLFRLSYGMKTGLLTATNLLMSFLAGMMFAEMKYLVARAVPLLSYINPAALITDAFYSLYIFDGYGRFFFNLGLLGLMAVTLSIISYLSLRSERYASL